MKNNFRKGFTLIEILIVVAIIAILATVILVGLGPSQQAGRDARRLSDLREVQQGLQLYFNKCGVYPGPVAGSISGSCASFSNNTWNNMTTALENAGIGVNSVPEDPNNTTGPTGSPTYYYATNAAGTDYLIGAVLETGNSAAFRGYTSPYGTSGNGYTFGDTMPSGITTPCAVNQMYCLTL